MNARRSVTTTNDDGYGWQIIKPRMNGRAREGKTTFGIITIQYVDKLKKTTKNFFPSFPPMLMVRADCVYNVNEHKLGSLLSSFLPPSTLLFCPSRTAMIDCLAAVAGCARKETLFLPVAIWSWTTRKKTPCHFGSFYFAKPLALPSLIFPHHQESLSREVVSSQPSWFQTKRHFDGEEVLAILFCSEISFWFFFMVGV